MKPQTFFIIALSILPCFFACQPETSEVEAKRRELEAKRQELNERKELAAVSEELKAIESEIDQVDGIKKAKTISSDAIAAGRIVGTNVIMRQDASVQSAKLANFDKGEQVAILSRLNSPMNNEAVLKQELVVQTERGPCTLPKGKVVVRQGVNDDGTYSVSFELPDKGQLTANISGTYLFSTWYLVKRSNGTQGWVSGQFLKEI